MLTSCLVYLKHVHPFFQPSPAPSMYGVYVDAVVSGNSARLITKSTVKVGRGVDTDFPTHTDHTYSISKKNSSGSLQYMSLTIPINAFVGLLCVVPLLGWDPANQKAQFSERTAQSTCLIHTIRDRTTPRPDAHGARLPSEGD